MTEPVPAPAKASPWQRIKAAVKWAAAHPHRVVAYATAVYTALHGAKLV